MMRLCAWFAVCLGACALASGCAPIANNPKGIVNPFLKPLDMGEDGVALEVFFARLPQDDAEQNAALWSEIDEQQLPTNIRRQWDANGLRAGFVGGQLPAKLAELLELGKNATSDGGKRPAGNDPRPLVSRRSIQLHNGNLNEILASPEIAQLALVVNEDGQLRGRNYASAQAQFSFKAYTQGDGRVRLEMTPELQYGEAKPRYVGEDGVFRLDASRPKQAFEKLQLEANLVPGQLLVLGHSIDRPGSLGYHFFTEDNNGRRETKLILIRIGQGQHDDLFGEVKEGRK